MKPVVDIRDIGRNGVTIAGTVVLRPESISVTAWLAHWEMYKRVVDEGFYLYDDLPITGANRRIREFPRL